MTALGHTANFTIGIKESALLSTADGFISTAKAPVRFNPVAGRSAANVKAFGRRPAAKAESLGMGRHPKPFTRTDHRVREEYVS